MSESHGHKISGWQVEELQHVHQIELVLRAVQLEAGGRQLEVRWDRSWSD